MYDCQKQCVSRELRAANSKYCVDVEVYRLKNSFYIQQHRSQFYFWFCGSPLLGSEANCPLAELCLETLRTILSFKFMNRR